jgi:hypothetical protein
MAMRTGLFEYVSIDVKELVLNGNERIGMIIFTSD